MSKKKNRNAKLKSKKAKKLPSYLIITILACVIMIIAVTISSIVIANRPPRIEFIPPEFDVNATSGVPDVPKELAYKELNEKGMSFKVGVCGEILIENGDAIVYFTNDETNIAWLKMRIIDENGNILGESGLIKPGEYLRSIKIISDITENTAIKLKIMSYEPNTYNSLGSISIKPIINIK